MSASRTRFVLNPQRYSQVERARSCFFFSFLYFHKSSRESARVDSSLKFFMLQQFISPHVSRILKRESKIYVLKIK